MNKQELIEQYREYENALFDIGAKVACQKFLQDLEQLDEPEKVTIPQFVAEIIEYYKKQNATLYDVLREKNFNKQYNDWLLNELDAYDKVARAWLDGYEVEKENQYVVTLKNGQPLVKSQPGSTLYFSQDVTAGNYKVTRKELEESGFGWVFDCEGIKIEEVE